MKHWVFEIEQVRNGQVVAKRQKQVTTFGGWGPGFEDTFDNAFNLLGLEAKLINAKDYERAELVRSSRLTPR